MTIYRKRLPSQRLGVRVHDRISKAMNDALCFLNDMVSDSWTFVSDILGGDSHGKRLERTGKHPCQTTIGGQVVRKEDITVMPDGERRVTVAGEQWHLHRGGFDWHRAEIRHLSDQ